MATITQQQTRLKNICCFIIFCASSVFGQSDQYARYYNRDYNRDRVNQQYNPNDRDYKTFMYNNRRYGVYHPDYYYGRGGEPYDPQRVGGYPNNRFDPNNRYDPEDNDRPILPGVLGAWRDDIQGKQRLDSLALDRDIFVQTNLGQVQGFLVNLYDKPHPDYLFRPASKPVDEIVGKASVFLGIPYAQPPVDQGRFKPPRPHKGWQMMQAVDFGPACPQPVEYIGFTKGIRHMHEDCLYLNVYTPTVKSVGVKYPVMFYIHGGEFSRGASNTFPGHILSTFYEVVVVTFNYRLGALGFLSTGDINSPGNYGILDQQMALNWVYENIEAFNGNNKLITLFGPGAGAASAGLLMVAPDTKNKIAGVIAQSGSGVADWALITDKYRAQNTSRVFGKLIGCSIESSWTLVNCLKQGRSFIELGNAEFSPEIGHYPWAPVIDMNVTMPYYEGWNEKEWHFLEETPEKLINQRLFNTGIRYMSGVTTQEAASFVYNNETLKPHYEIDEDFFHLKIKEMVLRYNYTLNPEGIYEAIKYMYTYWPDPHNKTHIREQYINMLSDFLYVASHDKMAKLLVQQNVPVYLYVLNTTVEAFNYPEWRKYPHDTEYFFLTGAPFMDVEIFPSKYRLDRNMWTDNDRNMSHFFMKAFSDFAKYGTPSHTQILGLKFEAAHLGHLKYLNINTTYNSSNLWNYRQTESAFFTQYLPTVVGRIAPTYPPTTEYWWEPKEPLQIAFWSMSATCLLLIVLVVVCCMLWRNAKRNSDRYYSGDIFLDNGDADIGIENHTRGSRDNIYEYRDAPVTKSSKPIKGGSTTSLRSSALSLKEMQSFTPSTTNGEPRKPTPVMSSKKSSHTRTHLVQGVPQTDV